MLLISRETRSCMGSGKSTPPSPSEKSVNLRTLCKCNDMFWVEKYVSICPGDSVKNYSVVLFVVSWQRKKQNQERNNPEKSGFESFSVLSWKFLSLSQGHLSTSIVMSLHNQCPSVLLSFPHEVTSALSSLCHFSLAPCRGVCEHHSQQNNSAGKAGRQFCPTTFSSNC